MRLFRPRTKYVVQNGILFYGPFRSVGAARTFIATLSPVTFPDPRAGKLIRLTPPPKVL